MHDRADHTDIRVRQWTLPGPPDEQRMKTLLHEEGFQDVHTFSDRPGAYYPDHRHDYVEVRWLVSGEVTFGVNGRHYTLQPGDRLDMPAHTVHDARIHPEEGAAYICASRPVED